jgi:xanthine dehydrogenase accessory factor
MREPGAHMAVADDGSFVGSLSGGCIERAVVAEAVDAIAEATPRVTRFGQGSRYIDIRLPCGGGVDLHFQPLFDGALAEQALGAIDARHPFSLELTTDQHAPRFSPNWYPTSWNVDLGLARVGHWPIPRLVIVGHGEAVSKLAWHGRAWGAEIAIVTPDAVLADRLMHDGFEPRVIHSPSDISALISDAWTAVVFLFHDHDWEPVLIAHALAQPNFFLGAMGSNRAHAARCAALRLLGVSEAAIDGISSPIGLFHSVRDPATLAISILAEIADRVRNHGAFNDATPPLMKPEIRQIG